MAKIIFYCNEKKENIYIFEYYKQDIDALEILGHEVVICTHYKEIPKDFDCMYIWWWTYALAPLLYSKLKKKPIIITGAYNFKFPQGFDGVDYFRRPLWQRFLISSATKLANLNLFINTFEKENCDKYFSIETGRFLPCVIGNDYLGPKHKKTSLSLFNIAWSGKENLRRKGIPELLDAVALLKKDGIVIELVMAGQKGDGHEWVCNKIKELDLTQEVTLLGPITKEEKIKLLEKVEIYIQPSHYEGFGLGIAEAMGFGCCIITCDTGAVRSVVGETGLYAIKGSAIDLAQKIKLAATDNELRIKLQNMAYQRAQQEFSPNKKVDMLRKYLSEIGLSSK